MFLSQLTESDWQNMANGIKTISNDWSEEELYENMGTALHDLGYKVSDAGANSILETKVGDSDSIFNVEKAVTYVADTKALSEEDAKKSGKLFWGRLKQELKHIICTNASLSDLINGDGDLKEYLKVLIPIILAGLGAATINPILLALICGAIALMLKVGFKQYCAA